MPPVANVRWPALGVHLLAAAGRAAGFDVRVRYVNAEYAARIGLDTYLTLVDAPGNLVLGDRLFCRAAWDAPPLGFSKEHLSGVQVDLERCEAEALALVDAIGPELGRARIVGVTSAFDTTAAGVALLRRAKAANPDVITIMGGANCEGAMGRAVAGLGPLPDHVFSGESEAAFVDFLRHGSPNRVIDSPPVRDMDALPIPEFSEFFAAIEPLGMDPDSVWVQLEASRGCWWGEKHHCTFCGLNGLGMAYRTKTPDRFLAEIAEVHAAAPHSKVAMTDNIMPHSYHRTVLPRVQERAPGVTMFWEQKANLDLRRCIGLRDAGATTLQPGIEAFDTELLALMDKGVTARQNVALLRYARVLGLTLRYSLLYEFPGDSADSYARTADLVPLLHHLQPPAGLGRLQIDRFSPYYERPADYGITDLHPWLCYGEVYPPGADLAGLATHHDGTYRSGARENPEVIARLGRLVYTWQERWSDSKPPGLFIRSPGPGRYLLFDERGLDQPASAWLSLAQAHAALVGGPLGKVPAAEWAIQRQLAVALDGHCVPLAVAPVELLLALEATAPDAVGPTLRRFGQAV